MSCFIFTPRHICLQSGIPYSFQDGGGTLAREEITTKMTSMLGSFSWADDGDGMMDQVSVTGFCGNVCPARMRLLNGLELGCEP